jgi:integrase
MAIYKQQKSGYWYIDFTDANGKRVRQSAGTENKQQAQELHDKLKYEAWRVKNIGDKPRRSWQEAVVRWLTEGSHKKSGRTDKSALRYLNFHLGDKWLDEINKALVDKIKLEKQASGITNETTNRILSVLRSVLIAAKKEWEWIDNIPTVKLLPIKSGRIRWITHEEAATLLAELEPHTKAMAQFALATGLRAANVINLQWHQIDMQRRCAWIEAENSKNGKAISVPLNDLAISVIRSQIGRHQTYVFTFRGKPVTVVNTGSWRKALKRAGIENFRWHDLRHTWASWHVQNGTPLHVLKELGGWSDLKMVLRYAHLSSEHLASYANNSNQAYDKLLSYPQKSHAIKTAYKA